MPNMFEDGAAEKTTNNMARIVSDTYTGGWGHVSSWLRGQKHYGWPTFHNQFDGFVYWSKITGRGKIIPDGDFTR